MIVRAKRKTNYTIISNVGLEDPRLGFRAKGLLAYLLTKPDDWQVRDRQLAAVGPDGRSAVQAALKELEECGYLVRRKQRNEHGQWEFVSYIYDEPWSENQATVVEKPWTGNPATEKPSTEKPSTENQAIVSTVSVSTVSPSTEGIKTEGTKAAAAATDGHSAVFRCWAENMSGTMTPILADQITELVNEHGHADVLRAIGIAVERGKRNLGYVRGILNRGIDSKPPTPAGNGYHNGNGAPLSKVDRSLQAVDNVERMMREQGLIQ